MGIHFNDRLTGRKKPFHYTDRTSKRITKEELNFSTMGLRKATRQKAKIRLGLSSVSGGGKTYSSLLIGKGLAGEWSKIAVIDTENGSADLYSHLGDYNVFPLAAPYSPEKYVEAIKECEKAGMEVIIIDSITHEWDGKGGCLEIAEQITQGSASKNSYTAWAKVTPRHQAFIDAMLQSSAHIITTVRRKQDYEMTKDSNGRTKVEKAGLKEVTREGWEYELTANLHLDTSHLAKASKDRTGLFMDKPEFIPTEQTGELIKVWCEDGEDPAQLVKDAVAKLDNCDTIDELKLFKETLPAFVVENSEFKIAGIKRFNLINNSKHA